VGVLANPQNENMPARDEYEEMPWDTAAVTLAEVTYAPSALSFEEEVIQACAAAKQM